MQIGCRLLDIKENTPEKPPDLQPGPYLEVGVTAEQQLKYIDWNKFVSKKRESKEVKTVSLSEAGIAAAPTGTRTDEETLIEKNVGSEIALDFLLSEIGIKSEDLLGSDELVVYSNLGDFLELPWESFTKTAVAVIRKFNDLGGSEEQLLKNKNNNLLVLMSHAYQGMGDNISKVMNQEIANIYESAHFLRSQRESAFRIDSIHLSKHTTKDVVEHRIHWGDFNLVHLIMHGDSIGRLGLEKPERDQYTHPDLISKDDFIQAIGPTEFDLVFLSLCYSGGGLDGDENSLAFQLVRGKKAKYVIGYRAAVGEFSARDFSKDFYENIISGLAISEVYKKTLLDYYKVKPESKYTPFLYMRI